MLACMFLDMWQHAPPHHHVNLAMFFHVTLCYVFVSCLCFLCFSRNTKCTEVLSRPARQCSEVSSSHVCAPRAPLQDVMDARHGGARVARPSGAVHFVPAKKHNMFRLAWWSRRPCEACLVTRDDVSRCPCTRCTTPIAPIALCFSCHMCHVMFFVFFVFFA